MAKDNNKQNESYLKRLEAANARILKTKEAEYKVQKDLSKILDAQINGSSSMVAKMQEKNKAALQGKSIEEQLKIIQQKREKVVASIAFSNSKAKQELLAQLNETEVILGTEVKRKDLAEEINTQAKETRDELYGSLGTLGEMLKAGTTLAVAFAALKGLTEAVSATFDATLGFASELNKELGISGEQAAKLGMMNFSLDVAFSRFSVEQLNQATKDFADTMGTTAGLTNDLRNSMAELSAMGVGGEDAAKLSQSFETANGSAADMTTEIKDMANDAGVMASTTFKDLATQQNLMLGATKAEIKELAKKTIELNKQGISLEQMKGISQSMMDIEGSMKAQAKARIMLQGKLSKDQMAGMKDMTAAALEFQRTGNMDVMTDALKRVKMSAKEFNDLGPRGQEVYAQSIGMTAETLGDVIRKQEQMGKVQENFGSGAASMLETYQRVPDSIKKGVSGLIAFAAQQMIISKMQTGSTGIGNIFGKKKSGGGPMDVEVPKSSGPVSKGASKSGGGLKSLASGLKALGSAKALAGVGVLALAGPALLLALPSIPFLAFMAAVPGKALQAGLKALGKGLTALGQAAASGMLFLGALALAAIGAAMIPFAYALSLLSPLVEAFGNIIVGVFSAIPPIITAVAEGFVTILGAVNPKNVLGMLMLGPALLSASVGMIAFSAAMAVGGIMSFFGGGIVDQIKELSEIGPGVKQAGDGLASVAGNIAIISGAMAGLGSLVSPLYLLAGGLMSISGGLTAIAFSGLLAMPVFAALTGLAAIAPVLEGLGSFFGMGGDNESSSSDSSMKDVVDAINELRGDISTQPIVLTIDGKAVQRISRVQSRQSAATRGSR
tara:strand:+ start:890 stop:3412 length:2523 start_codon:yes stop_codon:yes gene_type:complete